jgi:proteasome accessory factor B
MDRTERLLDLVALLLDAKEPISWAELRQSFPEDYGAGSDEAAERKFERDKAELLELGIPLTYVQGEDERRDGYAVDKEAYYLPEVGLSPEELAVLYAAGSAALASGAFPGSTDLTHALRKVGFFARVEGAEVPTPRVRMELDGRDSAPGLAGHLEALWGASAARKSVDLQYYSPRSKEVTQRRVDPYGLALRGGVWSLVGHCHLRGGIRTFHVHRIRSLQVNAARPRSPDFEVPEGFKLDDHVAQYPWQHAFHPAVDVTLRLTGELANLGERLFPPAQISAGSEGTSVIVSATDLEGLLRFALSLGHQAQVLAPEKARARWREMAAHILELHQPALAAAGGT